MKIRQNCSKAEIRNVFSKSRISIGVRSCQLATAATSPAPLDGSYVGHCLGALCWGAPRLRVLWGTLVPQAELQGSWPCGVPRERSEGAGKTLCTQRPPLDLYILLLTSVEHQGAAGRPRAFASFPLPHRNSKLTPSAKDGHSALRCSKDVAGTPPPWSNWVAPSDVCEGFLFPCFVPASVFLTLEKARVSPRN